MKFRGDTVLITGTLTNVCCESSARDAGTSATGWSWFGHWVVLVAGANAVRRDQDRNGTLHMVYRSFGDVRPTGEVLGQPEAARLSGPGTGPGQRTSRAATSLPSASRQGPSE
ncbi:hypothetical protein GCM10010430_76320 [Kitasatospora cystarginea]|uniref:Single-stranded DNA-binding protein n=1 Tax=Kitasatospora cystarginea TaxID=58350 RepID=A0ABN3F0T2_9ACTN